MIKDWKKIGKWSAFSTILGFVFILFQGLIGTVGVFMFLGGLILFIIARIKTN